MLAVQRQRNGGEVNINGHKSKRTKCPGIRVVGSRIYDSENGKTCHQCRQKTRDFAASCKNVKKGKPCTIKFCHKCLLNRYGEKAEEVELFGDWNCPKCRGICNCSFCMKRRGQKPTGPLAHTAKASGFSSVSEMLDVRSPENLEVNKVNDIVVSPKKKPTLKMDHTIGVDNSSSDEVLMSNAVSPKSSIAPEKELEVIIPSGELGKENSLDGNSGLKFESQKIQEASPEKHKKKKREGLKEISNGSKVDDVHQNKRLKRLPCNELSEEERKRTANVSIKDCNEVSEKETEVNRHHDDIHVPEKVPKTRASKDVSSNPNKKEVKEEIYEKNCKGTVVIDDDDNAGVKSQIAIGDPLKIRKCTANTESKPIMDEVPLPSGTMLTDISNIELPPEDVGNALQFLEFCRVFGKIVDVKKGEAEAILRELIRKQTLRRGQNTLAVQFHIRLLTLILSDSGNGSPSLSTATSGKNSWLKALEDLIPESDPVLKEFQLDWLKEGVCRYSDLDLSKKLQLLNFVCDEALGTEKMRSYIDEQNLKFTEKVKGAKSKVVAAKEKEKSLKQKLYDEVAKAIISKNGPPLSISEHDALLAKIKSEAAQAHAEMLEAKSKISKRKQVSDAMRTEPVFLDGNGHAFWKLRSYNAEYAFLLQDIKRQDGAAAVVDEKWFVYGPEKKREIDKYISSGAKRPKIQSFLHSFKRKL